MKQIIVIMALFLGTNLAIGQNTGLESRRYISVTGSAEIVVPPDEIELEIVLLEYGDSEDDKVSLKSIESNFFSVLRNNNIDSSQVVFGDSEYYWYYWWSCRNDNFKQKRYKIKLNSSTDFLSLVQDLDVQGVHALRVSNSSNKQLQKLRKEIKISALRAAKEKATYLLESIDEKVGKVISITEMPDSQNYYWRRNQNLISNIAVSSGASAEDIDNVAIIKLRYEVKAIFEIE